MAGESPAATWFVIMLTLRCLRSLPKLLAA